jgi:hypothetical protein
MKLRLLLGCLVAATAFLGCTGSPPEILQDHADVYLFRDRTLGMSYERLTFFVSARDEDGFEDIETLYLVHDEERLHWAVDVDRWQREEREEETWVGRNDIQMADYSSMPRGLYRVLLLDAAGERDQREIRVSTPEVPITAVSFPDLALENGRLIVDSIHARHTVHAFDAAGNLSASRDFGGGVLGVTDLVGQADLSQFTLYLYTFDEQNQIPLLSGPYQF